MEIKWFLTFVKLHTHDELMKKRIRSYLFKGLFHYLFKLFQSIRFNLTIVNKEEQIIKDKKNLDKVFKILDKNNE